MIADQLSSVRWSWGKLSGWRRLAGHLNIQSYVCEELDEHSKLSEPRKSPTKEVLKWLADRFPDTTLTDFVVVLEKTECKHAIQIITAHFPDTVGEYSTYSFSDLLCYYVWRGYKYIFQANKQLWLFMFLN